MKHEEEASWQAVLRAGVKAQRLVPGAVAVGGTAAALYAGHRLSQDTDHLLPALREDFDRVLGILEASSNWKTARVQHPVLILGTIDGVQVGFRQTRRVSSVETMPAETPYGPLIVPTLDELVGMKAYLAATRNALRDYLDFAALSQCAEADVVLAALLKSDARYGHLQTASIGLDIAKALTQPQPFDLDDIVLDQYKGLSSEWRSWDRIVAICSNFGRMLGKQLVMESAD